MLLTTTTAAHDLAHQLLAALPAQGVPNPAPENPPGFEKLTQILGYLKWIALAACGAAFLGGVIAFTAGRLVDNRRYGNTGALMMIAAFGGALLFGIGPQILNSFAGTG